MLKSISANAIGFAGLAIVTYGLSLWSLAAALIFSGLMLVASGIGLAAERPQPK
jgi:hypothetical protein